MLFRSRPYPVKYFTWPRCTRDDHHSKASQSPDQTQGDRQSISKHLSQFSGAAVLALASSLINRPPCADLQVKVYPADIAWQLGMRFSNGKGAAAHLVLAGEHGLRQGSGDIRILIPHKQTNQHAGYLIPGPNANGAKAWSNDPSGQLSSVFLGPGIRSATAPWAIGPVDGRSIDRKSTRLNSSHSGESRMPSSA